MLDGYKPRILQIIILAGGPVTTSIIKTHMPYLNWRILYTNLEKMTIDEDIVRKRFITENMDPIEYRPSDSRRGGRLPRYFYLPTAKGYQKYEYYKDKGVYDTEINLKEHWLKKKGMWS